MQANHIRDVTRDANYTKEGCEYSNAYWRLILSYRRMTELEREMELGLLIEQRNELHRRCKDNDKPGRRHMLPFVWSRRNGYTLTEIEMQVPMKLGTPAYEKAMAKIEAKIKEVRNGR